jgi:hypothetical protein
MFPVKRYAPGSTPVVRPRHRRHLGRRRTLKVSDPKSEVQTCVGVSIVLSGALRKRVAAAALSRLS